MKAELKQKWVEALRSGKYKQGQRCLRRNDSYCCLGVLCDLVNPDAWSELPSASGQYEHGDNGAAFPVVNFSEWFGVSDDGIGWEVATQNDEGKSFAQIADWIEANIPVESDSTGASES